MGNVSIAWAISLVLSIALPIRAQEVQTDSTRGPSRRQSESFELLPEYHQSADVLCFAAHRTQAQRERYFVEANADVDLLLLGFRRRIYSALSFDVRSGMGHQDGGVIFDPRDVRYSVIPWLELRTDLHLRLGLEHVCFHDIDRDDRRTEYWNKVAAEATSPNFGLAEYRRRLTDDDSWGRGARGSWSVRAGHYLDDAFGLISPVVLSGGQSYNWDGAAEGRWALLRNRNWVVALRGAASLTLGDACRPMQTYVVSVEAHIRRGAAGSMLFVNYNIEDQLQVRPRDGLVELGLRFYN